MFDADAYMNELTARLKERFGGRLAYVGLQGSYMRGEAAEESDIDAMVVLDGLHAEDMDAYRACIAAIQGAPQACGFLCGREELAHWNPLELCHLLHTTRDVFGALAPLLPAYSREDVCSYVKLSIGNLYHETVHRYVYAGEARSRMMLPVSLKGAFFILQNAVYLETGVFAPSRRALMLMLREADRRILDMPAALEGGEVTLWQAIDALLDWCRDWLTRL